MKYSQGRQNLLSERFFSRAKPFLKVSSLNHWVIERPKKFAGNVHKLLSFDVLAFWKQKSKTNTKKIGLTPITRVSTGNLASVDKTLNYYPATSFTQQQNVNCRDRSGPLINNCVSCNPVDIATITSEYVQRYHSRHAVHVTHSNNNAQLVGISSSQLNQILMFLYTDGFNRQKTKQKQISVSINFDHQNCFIAISDSGVSMSIAMSAKITAAKEHFGSLVDISDPNEQAIQNHINVLHVLMCLGGMLEIKSANNFYNVSLITLPLVATKVKSKSMANIDISAPSKSVVSCPANQYYSQAFDQDFIINDSNSLFMEKFKRILLENFQNQNFKRSVAASKLAISEKTLSRRLSYHYGSNFNLIIKNYRLNKAYQMLDNGESISNVAYNVGFNSASYFTKCFKRKFGFPPSNLRTKYN